MNGQFISCLHFYQCLQWKMWAQSDPLIQLAICKIIRSHLQFASNLAHCMTWIPKVCTSPDLGMTFGAFIFAPNLGSSHVKHLAWFCQVFPAPTLSLCTTKLLDVSQLVDASQPVTYCLIDNGPSWFMIKPWVI